MEKILIDFSKNETNWLRNGVKSFLRSQKWPRKFAPFLKQECLLSSSQESAIVHYPKPKESKPHLPHSIRYILALFFHAHVVLQSNLSL
jgi:hypothetical protein